MTGLNELQLFSQKIRCSDQSNGAPIQFPTDTGDFYWKGQIKGFKFTYSPPFSSTTINQQYITIDLSQESNTGNSVEPIGFMVTGMITPLEDNSSYKAEAFRQAVLFTPGTGDVYSGWINNETTQPQSLGTLLPSITSPLVNLSAFYTDPILYFNIEFKQNPISDYLVSGIYYSI